MSHALDERRARFQQQGVARSQRDVARLLREAFAAAGHGDDDGDGQGADEHHVRAYAAAPEHRQRGSR